MNLNMVSIVVCQTFNKYMETDLGLHPIDLMWMRQANLLPIFLVMAFATGHNPFKEIRGESVKYAVARAVTGNGGIFLFVIAIPNIPMVHAIILMNISPLWTAILGYVINQEKVSWKEVVCMLGAFIGVIVLTVSGPQ
jgi:drug/metabolite transporter (DMT)-like permease